MTVHGATGLFRHDPQSRADATLTRVAVAQWTAALAAAIVTFIASRLKLAPAWKFKGGLLTCFGHGSGLGRVRMDCIRLQSPHTGW
jgi:hypothetical protein